MKQMVTALVWPDGRVFAIHDDEVSDEVMFEHCPYMDMDKAVQTELEIEIPEKTM